MDPTEKNADFATPVRRIASEQLFVENSRRVVIRHNGRDYVLIITRQGKLVLNRLL